eukprot:Selendium_serpulae@DN9195_c0_g1_i1.p1
MVNRFANKLAVITGSTAGIGFAIAKRLAQEGATVVVSSRKETNVKEAVSFLRSEGLEVHGICCHVGASADRDHLLKQACKLDPKKDGTVDVLISNVATSSVMGATLDTSEEAFNKMLHNNVLAGFLLVKQAISANLMANNASILFVTSYLAFSPGPPIGAYGITKTALLGLVKALATELGPSGIRVNAVAPGVVKTEFSRALWEGADDENPQSPQYQLLQSVPLGRFAVAQEIAGPAAFMCSEDASYITGETLIVSGGMNSRL